MPSPFSFSSTACYLSSQSFSCESNPLVSVSAVSDFTLNSHTPVLKENPAALYVVSVIVGRCRGVHDCSLTNSRTTIAAPRQLFTWMTPASRGREIWRAASSAPSKLVRYTELDDRPSWMYTGDLSVAVLFHVSHADPHQPQKCRDVRGYRRKLKEKLTFKTRDPRYILSDACFVVSHLYNATRLNP